MEHPDLTRPLSYHRNPLAWTCSLFGGKRLIASQKWMDPMIRTSQTLSMAPLWAHQAPPLRSLEMFPSMGSLGHPFTCASPCRWGSVDGAWSCPNWSIWGKKESPESNTSMIVIPGLAFDWFQSCDTVYDNISSLHDGFGRFWPPLVLGRQRTIQLIFSCRFRVWQALSRR